VLADNLQDKLINRGLGLLSVHSQNFAPNSILAQEVAVLLDEALKLKNKVWLTSGDQIDAWWRARARVQVTSKLSNVGQLGVSVDNYGGSDIAGSQLVVTGPNASFKPVLTPTLPGLQVARQDELRWVVYLPTLRAGSSLKFTLRFVK
jgi:hypothetical protein